MIGVLVKKMVKKTLYYKYVKGYPLISRIFDKVLGRERLISIIVCGVKVKVRTNTPDIEVAISGLSGEEYSSVKVDNVKFIIDAGANIGTSAIYFAKQYPEVKIVAIEAEYSNYCILRENIAEYENITPVHAALWGSNCKKEIKDRKTGHWGYTVSDAEEHSSNTGQFVHCMTLNRVMKDYDFERIDILKIDIEGGEKDVFENSNGWIDSVETIVAELHDRINMDVIEHFGWQLKNLKI